MKIFLFPIILSDCLFVGKSKGIALVKFKTIDDSISFLKLYPVIEINGSSSWFEFGFEHSGDDWTCKFCHNINFHSREVCFKCSSSKPVLFAPPINDGRDDVSTSPTRFLLMRNLDDYLTAQKVLFRF